MILKLIVFLFFPPVVCFSTTSPDVLLGAVSSVSSVERKYYENDENFKYLNSLSLSGLNVLICGNKIYVNNIFPVGRGSNQLQGRKALEVCDLVALSLKFNYRDYSDLTHNLIVYGNYLDRYINANPDSTLKDFDGKYKIFMSLINQQTFQTEEEILTLIECNNYLIQIKSFFDMCHIDLSQDKKICDVLENLRKDVKDRLRNYMLEVNRYLNYFDHSFTIKELEKVNAIDGVKEVNAGILNYAQQISSQHSQFAHTEYELMYDLTHSNLLNPPSLNPIPSIEAMSYFDLCKNCENLWARKCIEKSVFISLRPYFDSRTRLRININNKLIEKQIN